MNFFKYIKIKNFFSIKNELILDFEASKYTVNQHPNRVISHNDKFFNKIISFYGPNGSGKSSILRAFTFLSSIIAFKAEGKFFPPGVKNIYNNSNTISYIEVSFVINKIDYIYKIIFESEKEIFTGIKDEILYMEQKNKKIKLIHRSKCVAKSLDNKNIDSILFDKVLRNKSILQELNTRTNDYEDFIFFFESVSKLTNIKGTDKINIDMSDDQDIFMLAVAVSEELPSVIKNNLLENNSIKNKDFSFVKEQKMKFVSFINRVFNAIGIDIADTNSNIDFKFNDDSENVEVALKMTTKHHINTNKSLNFKFESSGTKMLYKILYSIYHAKIFKTVAVLDELDSIVHPMIVPIINLLVAQNDVQIIYSSQNISNMKYLYSDEIFLIEKNSQHETTWIELKSKYTGFENFAKLYENKVLGGIPKIEVFDLEI